MVFGLGLSQESRNEWQKMAATCSSSRATPISTVVKPPRSVTCVVSQTPASVSVSHYGDEIPSIRCGSYLKKESVLTTAGFSAADAPPAAASGSSKNGSSLSEFPVVDKNRVTRSDTTLQLADNMRKTTESCTDHDNDDASSKLGAFKLSDESLTTQHAHTVAERLNVGKVLPYCYVALPFGTPSKDCFIPTLDIWTMHLGPIVHSTPAATFFLLLFRTQLWLGVVSNATASEARRLDVFNWVRARKSLGLSDFCASRLPSILGRKRHEDPVHALLRDAPTTSRAKRSCDVITDSAAAADVSQVDSKGLKTRCASVPSFDLTNTISGNLSRTRECSALLALASNEVFGIALCRGTNEEMSCVWDYCHNHASQDSLNATFSKTADCSRVGPTVTQMETTSTIFLPCENTNSVPYVSCFREALAVWLYVIGLSTLTTS